MRSGLLVLLFVLVVCLPSAMAYEVTVTAFPNDLPIISGTSYVDPYPAGEKVQVEVVLGCDEIAPADILAGRDVPFQLRREIDYQIGFGYDSDMPQGRFAIDPSPCLTDPDGSLQKTVTAYMAGSDLAFAYVPYNVTVGVYPDETQPASPSAGMETPPTVDFTADVAYIAGVWPTLANAHVQDGTVSMDILLQTNANADTVFEFTIVEGPDALDIPPFQVDVTKGHNAGLVTGTFPVPANATEESVYNWTIDFGGYAVQDPSGQVDVNRVELGIQPYKGGVPTTVAEDDGAGVDDASGNADGEVKATPAPLGLLALLAALGSARWSRR